jgi:hypothetical protein
MEPYYMTPPQGQQPEKKQRNSNTNVRKTRPYFKRQERQNGNNWVDKKSTEDIARDVEQIMRDFVHGNITEQDALYFWGNTGMGIRVGVFNKLTEFTARVAVNDRFIQTNGQMDDAIRQNIDTDSVRQRAWSDFQYALYQFADASSVSQEAAINYLVNQFQPWFAQTYRQYRFL